MRDRKMLGMGLIIGSAVTSGVVCSKAVTVLVGAAAGGGAVGAVGCVFGLCCWWRWVLCWALGCIGLGAFCDMIGQEPEKKKQMRSERFREIQREINA